MVAMSTAGAASLLTGWSASAPAVVAVLAIATDKTWNGGDTINELPADAAYSMVKIVKRK